MNESENQYATLYLSDIDELQSPKKSDEGKTDSGPGTQHPKPDYIENIFLGGGKWGSGDQRILRTVHKPLALSATAIWKKQLAEDMVKFIAPIRERGWRLSVPMTIQRIMEKGAEKARKARMPPWNWCIEAVGLNYY